jgi:hypothetical protein
MRKKFWGAYTPIRVTTGISKAQAVFAALWMALMAALGVAVANGQVSILMSRLGW